MISKERKKELIGWVADFTDTEWSFENFDEWYSAYNLTDEENNFLGEVQSCFTVDTAKAHKKAEEL